MKRSKILIVAGSTVLGLVGFFATKANTKFFSIAGKLKVGTALTQSVSTLPTSVDETHYFTTVKAGAAATVRLITIGGSSILSTLFTSLGNNKLYFK